MSQDLCSSCGDKITKSRAYYWLDEVNRLRLKCKRCYQTITGKTDAEMGEFEKDLDNETVD